LYTDGKKVGEGDIPMTLAMVFSADDGCDVGEDTGAPVSEDYGPRGNAFNGQVKGVQIAIADAAENSDHRSRPRKSSASRWLVSEPDSNKVARPPEYPPPSWRRCATTGSTPHGA
jgi:hypothetical protein